MQAKSGVGAQPQVQYKYPKPGNPLPAPGLVDMDNVHKMVASGALADVLAKIGKPR